MTRAEAVATLQRMPLTTLGLSSSELAALEVAVAALTPKAKAAPKPKKGTAIHHLWLMAQAGASPEAVARVRNWRPGVAGAPELSSVAALTMREQELDKAGKITAGIRADFGRRAA